MSESKEINLFTKYSIEYLNEMMDGFEEDLKPFAYIPDQEPVAYSKEEMIRLTARLRAVQTFGSYLRDKVVIFSENKKLKSRINSILNRAFEYDNNCPAEISEDCLETTD